MASDGAMKIKAMLPTHLAPEINSGKLQNLGLIRILDAIPNQPEKALIVTKCEVVSPSVEMEIKTEVKKEESQSDVKKEESAILLMPKQEIVAKSAAQIVNEQRGNAAPAARLAMTKRIHPLASNHV